ncbi:hypothetical protein D9M69_582140 [compost metagenome]
MKKEKKPIAYDAKKFVRVSYAHLLAPRPHIRHHSLRPIRECLESAIHMAGQIELIDNCLFDQRPEKVRAAYFRASLTELCRVEDAAKVLGKRVSFYESDDPSLHIVKLLRNYQVHLSTTKLNAGTKKVKFSGEIMDYHTFLAENVTASQLRQLDSSARYSDEQLTELVMLFEQEQRQLGMV